MEALRDFLNMVVPLLAIAAAIFLMWRSLSNKDDDDFPGGTPA